MHEQLGKKWLCLDLPVWEYTEARKLQAQLVSRIKDGSIDTNVVLMLEHPPVFTVGRRGGSKNLTVSEGVLRKAGIPVIHVERGGDITFHGPGQLIVYPIIDLRAVNMSVTDYVEGLEEVMIRIAGQWGIKACRNPANRGIWVANNKLGSIGIAIRHGITFHGLALNVNLSLEPFGWINPCGLKDVGATSMERELSRKVRMNRVREGVKYHFKAVFGVDLIMTRLSELTVSQKV
ncbi:MAG: lipoyl(octanoyl) transferase LipB [Deltaproteobacteria bacterium]|nr:lipoyl(octanoyl) transferase LipB [Deltaproteobacteria bacterium]